MVARFEAKVCGKVMSLPEWHADGVVAQCLLAICNSCKISCLRDVSWCGIVGCEPLENSVTGLKAEPVEALHHERICDMLYGWNHKFCFQYHRPASINFT